MFRRVHKTKKLEDKNTSNKPKDSPFKQQKLPAWQPIMTTHSALPIFFTVGIIFIPIGVACLLTSNAVQDFTIDYTDCTNQFGRLCSDVITTNIYDNCICYKSVNIEESFKGNVFFYYGLERFWQNLRRYVVSRDDNQLVGRLDPVSSDTIPFRNPGNSSKYYAPAGAIANSMFNDSFELIYRDDSISNTPITVPWVNSEIAWQTDVAYKFQNPPTFNNTIKPVYWRKPVYELDPSNPTNNGYLNEDFIVWMRTAAFPKFRKLYRRLNHQSNVDKSHVIFKDSLPAGMYNLSINYNFPVVAFKGRKLFIISTTSWLGSKNSFLGYAYISVGSICILTGFIFLVLHLNFNDRVTRHDELFEI